MILLSGLLALQDKESTHTDFSVQISTDKLNKDITGNLYTTYCTLSSNSSSNDGLITSYMDRLS